MDGLPVLVRFVSTVEAVEHIQDRDATCMGFLPVDVGINSTEIRDAWRLTAAAHEAHARSGYPCKTKLQVLVGGWAY